jgi:hypothetical protein
MVKPSVIGLRRSFGFGDRLGMATAGHIDALKGSDLVPIFAQQSIRELRRTGRSPDQVMKAAVDTLSAEDWQGDWGADADHLQTREDVQLMAGHGYTFFTIDPSNYVNDRASKLDGASLASAYTTYCKESGLAEDAYVDLYLGHAFTVETYTFVYEEREALMRAVLKYSAAIDFAEKMFRWILEAARSKPVEIELSIDETDQPTSPLEHLLIGLELKRRNVEIISLAPRYVGDFEKGIDYKGDHGFFETELKKHMAIARYCGPYKLSMHSGSDKFAIYPVFSQICGNLLHVKTAGTSYLEALRVVCRTDRIFFRELVSYCRSCYSRDKASYHVSAKLAHVPENPDDDQLEKWYLDNEAGRQILHVTFGSVLSDNPANRQKGYKERLITCLMAHRDLYRELLGRHLGKHIQLLS